MSHTDKMAKNQTVLLVFQKIFSFMTEILFYLASKMIYPMGKHYVTQGHFCTQFLVFSIASEKQLLMLIY